MKLNTIVSGLKSLLEANHYTPATIRIYDREWSNLELFLRNEYGDTEFTMERGMAYLEKKHGIISCINDGTLLQQKVQYIRMIHMLEDYQLHGVLTRRYYASKNPTLLNDMYSSMYHQFCSFIQKTYRSKATVDHYSTTAHIFIDYLQQKKINDITQINYEIVTAFIRTLAGYSWKTVEQHICGIRCFLRWLDQSGNYRQEIAEKIHMPPIPKDTKIPSNWAAEDLKKMLSTIDRNSPIGKRDYAMILLACTMGYRSGDIIRLCFSNVDWESKTISIVQHKTNKLLTLPMPDAVGWALIDYIKNGRPDYRETDRIFIKHMPPFDPISEGNHMNQQLSRYFRKAGINVNQRRHGFHSLRHTAASILLEENTPLPVISTVLVHSNTDITSIYLKTDIEKLRDCVLPLDF